MDAFEGCYVELNLKSENNILFFTVKSRQNLADPNTEARRWHYHDLEFGRRQYAAMSVKMNNALLYLIQ